MAWNCSSEIETPIEVGTAAVTPFDFVMRFANLNDESAADEDEDEDAVGEDEGMRRPPADGGGGAATKSDE